MLFTLVALFALAAFGKCQDRSPPPAPARPDYVDPMSFHGSRFEYFDEIAHESGFVDDGTNPAVVHTPVFLYGRSAKNVDPCYPEGATNADGTGPNPGTKTPFSINPGADCTNPGPYNGDYSAGDPFPAYVSAVWCGAHHEWRIDYSLYYVHDGNMRAGHKHDWEGVTVVFQQDPGARGEDWWRAVGVIFHHHADFDFYSWSDITTIADLSDIRTETQHNQKNHVKVYVGLYSHSAYRLKCDIGCGYLTNTGKTWYEYRSSDWARLVQAADLRLYSDLKEEWCTDDKYLWTGMNNPWKNKQTGCDWTVRIGVDVEPSEISGEETEVGNFTRRRRVREGR